jgi:fermentation-respiration switch protein FrsA (DUF1100 family)
LCSWLNQWSVETSLADALTWLPEVSVPVLVASGTADQVVPTTLAQEMYDAARDGTREQLWMKGASHYFAGQPDVLAEALDSLADWVERAVGTARNPAETELSIPSER